jgi:hypothetical protein
MHHAGWTRPYKPLEHLGKDHPWSPSNEVFHNSNGCTEYQIRRRYEMSPLEGWLSSLTAVRTQTNLSATGQMDLPPSQQELVVLAGYRQRTFRATLLSGWKA